MATVDGSPSTARVLIRLDTEEDPKDMGLHVMDESVRADEEASYMLAEAEVRQ